MDVSRYFGGSFIKVADIKANGPTRVRIVDVSEGRFDKPVLTFDDGTKLSVNATNGRVMAKAYGFESDDWINKEVELVVGEIEYQGKPQEAVLIKPISPPIEKAPPIEEKVSSAPASKPKPSGRGDMDDEIPF